MAEVTVDNGVNVAALKAAREALGRARRRLAVSPRRLYDKWAVRLEEQLAK